MLELKHFKHTILILVIMLIIFVSGCTKSKVTCNAPYIIHKTTCCIDKNNNSICDKEENASVENVSMETHPILQQKTSLNNGGKVNTIISKVIDGDTIKLKTGETVRLLGINAPEKGQPYYEEATNRLKELVEGKEVALERDIDDKDKYGRLLRYIFVNGENINVELIREGLATLYIVPPNFKYRYELEQAQNEAKTLKRNIWKQPKEDVCDNQCIGISYFHWNAEGNDCNNLNDEYVVLKNSCAYSCNLTGWTIKDESSRNLYVFPNFILKGQALVTLYTGCGINTNTKLYWCNSGSQCNAVWNNYGDTLYLRNSNGELILSYSYTGY